jgi:hypothetical protein
MNKLRREWAAFLVRAENYSTRRCTPVPKIKTYFHVFLFQINLRESTRREKTCI